MVEFTNQMEKHDRNIADITNSARKISESTKNLKETIDNLFITRNRTIALLDTHFPRKSEKTKTDVITESDMDISFYHDEDDDTEEYPSPTKDSECDVSFSFSFSSCDQEEDTIVPRVLFQPTPPSTPSTAAHGKGRNAALWLKSESPLRTFKYR